MDLNTQWRLNVYRPRALIVPSAEAVQRELLESTKDNIRSRIASTIKSASLPDSNSTKDDRQALKRLKTDQQNIAILPDSCDKMDALVNDKQTHEELKWDPTPALQHELNSKLLDLKKTDAIDIPRYNRLRCRAPQPPKLSGLPKLHKPQLHTHATRSLVLWPPTYQLCMSK